MELRLAPSILSADFTRLGEEVADVSSVSDLIHVDVMDGHYVPNLTLGPVVVEWLRGATPLPLDTHLMITDPRGFAPQFAAAGSSSVTFHPEVDADPRGLVDVLHDLGTGAGVALRPPMPLTQVEDLLEAVDLLLCMTVEPGFGGQAFMPEVLPKIEEAAAWRERHGASFSIEVDGGIGPETARQTVAAGADTLVAGSAIFAHADRLAAAHRIREAAAGAVARPA